MTRITKSQVKARVETASKVTGRTIQVRGAYGGYNLYEITNEHGGVSDLMYGTHTLRECMLFLDGMICAAGMLKG